ARGGVRDPFRRRSTSTTGFDVVHSGGITFSDAPHDWRHSLLAVHRSSLQRCWCGRSKQRATCRRCSSRCFSCSDSLLPRRRSTEYLCTWRQSRAPASCFNSCLGRSALPCCRSSPSLGWSRLELGEHTKAQGVSRGAIGASAAYRVVG